MKNKTFIFIAFFVFSCATPVNNYYGLVSSETIQKNLVEKGSIYSASANEILFRQSCFFLYLSISFFESCRQQCLDLETLLLELGFLFGSVELALGDTVFAFFFFCHTPPDSAPGEAIQVECAAFIGESSSAWLAA